MIYDFILDNTYVIIQNHRATHQFTRMSAMYDLYVEYQNRRRQHVFDYEMFSYQMLQKKELFLLNLGGNNYINIHKIPSPLYVLDIWQRRIDFTREVLSATNNNQDEEERKLKAMLAAAPDQPLTKKETVQILIQMQKRIGNVAMGAYETTSTKYKVFLNPYTGLETETPYERVRQTHLPKIEYVSAFKMIGDIIEHMTNKADLGESNQATLERYQKYITEIGGRYQEVF